MYYNDTQHEMQEDLLISFWRRETNCGDSVSTIVYYLKYLLLI